MLCSIKISYSYPKQSPSLNVSRVPAFHLEGEHSLSVLPWFFLRTVEPCVSTNWRRTPSVSCRIICGLQLNCVSKGLSYDFLLKLSHPSASPIPTAKFLCLDTDGPLSSSPPCARLLLLAAPSVGLMLHYTLQNSCNSCTFLGKCWYKPSLPESGNILILPELRLVSTLLLTFLRQISWSGSANVSFLRA